MSITQTQPAAAAPTRPRSSRRKHARLSSAALFGGAVELVIEHRGAEYRLRQTAQGKLILTK